MIIQNARRIGRNRLSPVASDTTHLDLLDNLIEWWQLDEYSGTRAGVVSGLDLTDNNTVIGGDGVQASLASLFTTANSEYLSRASESSLQTGDIDFTFSFWFNVTTLTVTRVLLSKRTDVAGQTEYIFYVASDGTMSFRVELADNSAKQADTTAGAIVVNKWYFVCGWHDSVNDTVNLEINNNGTVYSTATTGALHGGSVAQFRIGAQNWTGAEAYHDGQIQKIGFWKRVLTSTERTYLYNKGTGRSYPFPAQRNPYSTIFTNLVEFWPLKESSGYREGIYAGKTLTDNNTVSFVAGKGIDNIGGRSAFFTAANSEYLSVASDSSLQFGTGDFTICGWFYCNTIAATQFTLVSKDYLGFEIFVYDGALSAYIGGVANSLGVTSSVVTNTWYHVVLRRSGSTCTLWKDGSIIHTVENSADASNGSVAVNFGRRNNSPAYYFDGYMADWGMWNKALSDDEIAFIYNSGLEKRYPLNSDYNTVDGLLYKLVDWWPLKESSGIRFGFHSRLYLTDNNTVTGTTGPDGSRASQFTRTNSEYLSRASESALQTGDIDFTICAWVYMDSKPSTDYNSIVTKFELTSPANQAEFSVDYREAIDRFRFVVSSDGTSTFGTATADNLGSPSISTWYFIVAWHDSVNNTVNIQVNNGSIDSSAWSSGVFSGSATFDIGRTGPTLTRYMNGRIQRVGFWKRVLTTDEKTYLYNSGQGKDLPYYV